MTEEKTPLQQRGEEFMMTLGMCVTEWAGIDEQLFHICQRCLGCTQEQAAIVYQRTTTIGARRQLVSDLLATLLPKRADQGKHSQDVALWAAVNKTMIDLLPIRNRLAHQPVSKRERHAIASIFRAGEPLWDFWFESHAHDFDGRSSEPLKLADLQDHLAAVNKLSSELYKFRHRVFPVRRHRAGTQT